MGFNYLVRYGLWRQVGRFASDWPELQRGQTVVVRSHRGTELGEVLTATSAVPEDSSPADLREAARVLRPASPEDLERARRLEQERPGRFELCQRVIRAHGETLELIDVEPLLDDRRIVLHYLGPHHLDTAGLLAALGANCKIEGILEPMGRDPSDGSSTCGGGCDHCSGGGEHHESAHGGCATCASGCSLASVHSHRPHAVER
jgi:cell fate regulator YaaT (PSP1 superfamily)